MRVVGQQHRLSALSHSQNIMHHRFMYFDLGKVLVHFDHQIAVEQLAELSRRPAELVQQVVFDSGLQNDYETGLVDSPQFVARVNTALESDLSTTDVLRAISDIFTPNQSILEAIGLVQSSGVPLGILSNTCEAHWQWIMQQRWPMFGPWWSQIVLSYEVGSMKPAGPIYQVCEQKAGCPPEQILFTDDRPENVAAAAQRGWSTHLFTSTAELLSELKNWLALVPK